MALALGCWSCGSSGESGTPDGSVVSNDAAAPRDAGGSGETAPTDGVAPGDGSRDAAVEASHSVITVPLTGCSESVYLAEIELGGSQSFQALLDTGSATLAVAAAACTSCGVTPLYTPGPHATDEHQSSMAVYGDGMDGGILGWTGEIYDDTVSLGGTSGAATQMNLVAIQTQDQFFFPDVCGSSTLAWQGIVGLAPAADDLPGTDAYFDKLIAAQSLPNVFALQLCEPGGHLWLGGYDETFTTAPPQYVPSTTSNASSSNYVVDLERVVVDGVSADVPVAPYGDTLLDSGTNAFLLPPAALTTLANAITASAGFQAAFGAGADAGASFFSATSSCATTSLTKEQLDAALPPMTLEFGTSAPVSVKAVATESYLVPFGGGMWCPGMLPLAPDDGFPFSATLGSTVLRSNIVIFDREHKRFGFAPHVPCP